MDSVKISQEQKKNGCNATPAGMETSHATPVGM